MTYNRNDSIISISPVEPYCVPGPEAYQYRATRGWQKCTWFSVIRSKHTMQPETRHLVQHEVFLSEGNEAKSPSEHSACPIHLDRLITSCAILLSFRHP